jgi:hypothetical protein
MSYLERLAQIDRGDALPMHSSLRDKLREQLGNLERNMQNMPAGFDDADGPCICAGAEGHEGKCLGPDCYCH